MLDKLGVDVERLVLIARAGVDVDGVSDHSSDDNEEEKEQELLTARLAGKVVRLAGQQDVESLCDSAANLLAFGERRQQHGDTVVDESAPPAAAAAVKAAETSPPPPPLPSVLSDADMIMVGSRQIAT